MLFTTRRVFFYSILTLLPWFCYEPLPLDFSILLQKEVIFNLLFLSLIASSLCFYIWNIIIKNLGAVHTNYYIYFISIVTLFVSWLVLDEKITAYALLGAVLILSGVYLAERKTNKIK